MPYADPLDPLTPGGSAGLVDGDDRIREMKRAIIQRLGSIVVDVDANPLQLKTTALGTQGVYANIATAVAQAILVMTAVDALYMIFSWVEGGPATDVTFGYARSSVNATYALWGETKPAANFIALSIAGATINATQTTGANKTIHSVAIRVY